MTHIFKVLEQISDSLPLAVSENGFVKAITGFPYEFVIVVRRSSSLFFFLSYEGGAAMLSYLHSMRSCRCPS